MHGDAALDPAYRKEVMPASTLTGEANLLVLPNIDAANIAYNLLKTAAGGGIAIGPVLLGADKPVHILTPSATVRRIVNMTALTVADANAARWRASYRRVLCRSGYMHARCARLLSVVPPCPP